MRFCSGRCPTSDPGRLVAVAGLYKSDTSTRRTAVIPLTEMAEWRTRSQKFLAMGAFAYTQLPMRVGSQSFSPVTALMDPEFLPTLGNQWRWARFSAVQRPARPT